MVGCILRLLEIDIEGAFVNQPELADLDTFYFAIPKQAPKVLQGIATVGSSHLHRYVIV